MLTCADGTRAFLEAVGTPLDPDTPDLHRTEARVAAALPPDLPAPRLRWWTERDVGGDVWVALLVDAVDGEPPALPWTPAAAARIVPVLTDLARQVPRARCRDCRRRTSTRGSAGTWTGRPPCPTG